MFYFFLGNGIIKTVLLFFIGMYIVKKKSLAMVQAFFEHEVTFTK